MQNYQMLINGEFVDAASGDTIDSSNPYSGEVWATIPRAGPQEVDQAVRAAHATFTSPSWRRTSASARGAILRKVADLLAARAEEFAQLETRDNGKTLHQTRAEVQFVLSGLYFYAGAADKLEGTVPSLDIPDVLGLILKEPVGVVACITPWNSPLMMAVTKIAPAFATGCTCVLKPSEFTSATALELARLFVEAGSPPGAVNVITGLGSEIGDALVGHELVSKVSFTGGTSTGRRVSELAARGHKKVTLELGGKSPHIIFEDADLESAARGALVGIFTSSGQSCAAGSRLLVQRSIHDKFVEIVLDLARGITVGDPMDPKTGIGPITTRPQYDRVLGLLEAAKAEGAKCILGGTGVPGDGQMVPPTIFTGVTNDMRIAKEEVFGPVLSVIQFDNEEEAIRLANETDYGLASGVWTSDLARAYRMIREINAGAVYVNAYRLASFLMPHSGRKNSGPGSENGFANLESFLQPKAVWINAGVPMNAPFLPA